MDINSFITAFITAFITSIVTTAVLINLRKRKEANRNTSKNKGCYI